MFCEKCGTKNKPEAKFCEKCGHKIELKKSQKNNNALINKFKSLSKQNKIVMLIVLTITIIALITLSILLNNPIKKMEDYLLSYYDNYSENNNKELIEMGKILKSNRNDEKILNKLKNTTNRAMTRWVKNFNTEYKDSKELNDNYQKVSGALKEIYNYYNGLEYMLDNNLYKEYKNEILTLYYSKTAYFEVTKYAEENNSHEAYYYYQKVDSLDCYYSKANTFVKEYIKEEITTLKEKADELININNESSHEEILEAYLEKLKYLNENNIINKIDLSNTEDYQNLYKETLKIILDNINKIIPKKEAELKYQDIIEYIDKTLELLKSNSNTEEYKELTKLKEKYNEKLPDSLIDKYRVSYKGARYSKSPLKIYDIEYKNSLNFSFDGETQYVVYRLNGEYKKLKTTIVRGEDWDKEFNGTIIIYGDDKELYRNDNITKNSDLQADIDIDITGIDDLKIEFITTSESASGPYFYIYLVEPYLYK